MGDAKSLQGGTLMVTPLIGADGEVYAVGQGPVVVGGFQAAGAGQAVKTRACRPAAGCPAAPRSSAKLPNTLDDLDTLRLALRDPDFTTAEPHRAGDQRATRRAA